MTFTVYNLESVRIDKWTRVCLRVNWSTSFIEIQLENEIRIMAINSTSMHKREADRGH